MSHWPETYARRKNSSRLFRIKRAFCSNDPHAHQVIWDEINSCPPEQLPKLVNKLNTFGEFADDPIVIVDGEAMLTSEYQLNGGV
jgi:hypothetical protein